MVSRKCIKCDQWVSFWPNWYSSTADWHWLTWSHLGRMAPGYLVRMVCYFFKFFRWFLPWILHHSINTNKNRESRLSSFQFVPVMSHRRISFGSSHLPFINRWEVNDAWVKSGCGGVTLPCFKCITHGTDPPLSSFWCADPLWRWEMPQSDSYCIDFTQPANTCYTNAILLLLAAANQVVGDNPCSHQQPGHLRLQAHAYTHTVTSRGNLESPISLMCVVLKM